MKLIFESGALTDMDEIRQKTKIGIGQIISNLRIRLLLERTDKTNWQR